MIRYFVIATIIVLFVAVIGSAGWLSQRAKLRIASVATTMAPRAEPTQGLGNPANGQPFIATVPWALSVLPECLQQTMSVRGDVAFVLKKFPAEAVRIRSPAELHYADCTIHLSGESALVTRGVDRLRIPPRVRFYKDVQGRLFVLRVERTQADLRVYTPPH